MRTTETAAIAGQILLITALLFTRPALAHVEGHMPDSVAEMEYRILLEFKPNEYVTRTKLATALMNQDKIREAEQEFERVLAKVPDHLPALMGLSLLRLKQNRVAEALSLAGKIAAQAPENSAVYLNYGKILEADKRPREALQMYRLGLSKIDDAAQGQETLHERQIFLDAIENIETQAK